MAVTAAPPTVLSMDEYRSRWQPEGWELIIIGPTSTWRQEWGEWQAIRDIVQNALDESEFYRWDYDDKGLWIRDTGRGVAVADFLLGPPRLKPDYARGKFGEGMKIAALALVRKGYSVHIETIGRELWIVFLEQKVNGTAETLAALWRPNGRHRGTEFHIIGYFGTAFEKRFAVNLPREAILARAPSPVTEPRKRYNQLLNAAYTDGPMIYARDIFMRDLNSLFSYNLWGFPMAPDRHGAEREGDVWADMGRLWSCVTEVKWLEIFMQMMRRPPVVETDESFNLSMGAFEMGREPASGRDYADFVNDNAELWRKAWGNNFGEAAVIRTSDRWDGTVKHLGYSSVSVHYGVESTLGRAITTDTELVQTSQERLREVETIPDEKLPPRQLAHLKLAREIVGRFRFPPVRGVHAAMIPPASDRVRTAGMYSKATQEIFISADQLSRGGKTVDTVIHELAHHTSGAEDMEEPHSRAMTEVAGRVVALTAQGTFDEQLKDARW